MPCDSRPMYGQLRITVSLQLVGLSTKAEPVLATGVAGRVHRALLLYPVPCHHLLAWVPHGEKPQLVRCEKNTLMNICGATRRSSWRPIDALQSACRARQSLGNTTSSVLLHPSKLQAACVSSRGVTTWKRNLTIPKIFPTIASPPPAWDGQGLLGWAELSLITLGRHLGRRRKVNVIALTSAPPVENSRALRNVVGYWFLNSESQKRANIPSDKKAFDITDVAEERPYSWGFAVPSRCSSMAQRELGSRYQMCTLEDKRAGNRRECGGGPEMPAEVPTYRDRPMQYLAILHRTQSTILLWKLSHEAARSSDKKDGVNRQRINDRPGKLRFITTYDRGSLKVISDPNSSYSCALHARLTAVALHSSIAIHLKARARRAREARAILRSRITTPSIEVGRCKFQWGFLETAPWPLGAYRLGSDDDDCSLQGTSLIGEKIGQVVSPAVKMVSTIVSPHATLENATSRRPLTTCPEINFGQSESPFEWVFVNTRLHWKPNS
ncbi:uncharacterized protein CLUP02_09686 [Colletotrichum lupini]|uniref:Uncharacterized protein n=1 Tax=Colletotrichum lupini TaxID=145971 RepID=A0A9Q8SW55_9PEZI|nr:uncharacterized protein CLUP02_09686 [Colletotrichum lupini]UQC84190.1 hypothetical protein CLUP02_09686 [Colletotrichum lupini]